MKYTLDNGRTITIPDKDIERLEKSLKISHDEAVYTWLVDEEYISDETVEELTAKAKENRVTATVHKAKSAESEKKVRKPREKKENPTKKQIIEVISDALTKHFGENATISVTNAEKYIDLTLTEGNFTINLVQHRAKKAT